MVGSTTKLSFGAIKLYKASGGAWHSRLAEKGGLNEEENVN
jgi:hypothetical protein